MFKFLKDKLKTAVSKFSKEVDEQAEEVKEVVEKPKKEKKKEKPKPKKEKKPKEKKEKAEEKPKVEEKKEEPKEEKKVVEEEKKGFFGKLKEKFKKEEEPEEKEEVVEEVKEEIKEEPKVEEPIVEEKPKEEPKVEEVVEEKEVEEVKEEPKVVEEKEEKKGFFGKLKETVTKKVLSESKFDDLFWEIELVLLENNVAVEVIEKIKSDLKEKLVNQKVQRGKIEETIFETLKQSVGDLFEIPQVNLIEEAKKKKPYVIALIGVNGSGKTTTIAKMVKYFQDNNLKCVLAAADTFRAAAIQQLEEHANKLNVKMIKHDYGSDPAAVAFDAIKYAKSKELDVVLIDTAGRLHSNVDLMNEMKKIIRVANPDLKIFIGESITGNDCVDQIRMFSEAVDIDGSILSKADIDEKGGAALSISYISKKPIFFFGVGQEYKDLEKFDKNKILERIGLA